ncbi:transposase [Streptomyces sp. NPDC059894]|uniref:transposase n=1 Tax=unclassified Streptomyces TaxID=2593676 RepID=UPI0036495161
MKRRIGSYPRVRIEGGGRAVVSQAGGVLLVETVRKAGLDTAISAALTPWRKPRAVHDPGKILLDVALAVALGGDCLADVGMLRAEPAVFGPDGMRITCFATNTADRPIAELELRHRLRARAEDRIRAARATGLRNLPLHHTAQNKVWLEIVQIALDLLAWMPMLALTGQARLFEPRRLRFRLFSAAGQLVTTGRRRILRLARHWPWTHEITGALERLALLPNPG